MRKSHLKKCLGYCKIKNIDNPCKVVVVVIPKEYYDHFEDFRCNKKYKGIKEGSPGRNFQNFTERIVSVVVNFENPKIEYQEQQRCSVFGGKIQKI